MKGLARAALAAAVLAPAAGCADLITGGPLIRPGEPTGYIEVVNGSNVALDVVVISACSAGSYGLNRLPDGYAIAPRDSFVFEVSAGCWDIGGGAVGVGDAFERIQVPAGGLFRYTITGG